MVWGTKSPSGVQEQSPGRGLGDFNVPQKLKHFLKIGINFYKKNNCKIVYSSPEVLFKTCVTMKFVDDDDDTSCSVNFLLLLTRQTECQTTHFLQVQ